MTSAATVEKALDVLFHLHGERRAVGVSSLGRALGLPKSSTHRLLCALASRGLVERDERGRYRPGMGLVALGLGAQRADVLVIAGRPVIQAVAESVGETTFLVGIRGQRLIVLDRADGRGFLRAAPDLGAELPIERTAVGRLYRVFGPDPATADDPALERVRTAGWAENRGEWIAGLGVVAAPIRALGHLVGAIALGAPLAQLEVLGFEPCGGVLLEAAARIEHRLEGTQS